MESCLYIWRSREDLIFIWNTFELSSTLTLKAFQLSNKEWNVQIPDKLEFQREKSLKSRQNPFF